MISKEEREKLEIDGRIYICYDYLFAIEKDRILATHGSSVSLITDTAELLCTFDNIIVPTKPGDVHYDAEHLEYYSDEDFIQDYLIYMQNGKFGLLDYDGTVVIEAQYSSIEFGADYELYVLP